MSHPDEVNYIVLDGRKASQPPHECIKPSRVPMTDVLMDDSRAVVVSAGGLLLSRQGSIMSVS